MVLFPGNKSEREKEEFVFEIHSFSLWMQRKGLGHFRKELQHSWSGVAIIAFLYVCTPVIRVYYT